MPNSCARKSSRCGATSISSADSALAPASPGAARAASSRSASAASAARRCARNSASMRLVAVDRIQVGEREAVGEREHGKADEVRRGGGHRGAKACLFYLSRTSSPAPAASICLGPLRRAVPACQRRDELPIVRSTRAARGALMAPPSPLPENRMTVSRRLARRRRVALLAAAPSFARSRSSSAS